MTLGFEMKILDLGAGFPHFGTLSGPIFEDIVTVLQSALAFHFQQRDFENIRFIADPSKEWVSKSLKDNFFSRFFFKKLAHKPNQKFVRY